MIFFIPNHFDQQTIHKELIALNKKAIDEQAKKDAAIQENMSFRVQGNMAPATPLNDQPPKIKLKVIDMPYSTVTEIKGHIDILRACLSIYDILFKLIICQTVCILWSPLILTVLGRQKTDTINRCY